MANKEYVTASILEFSAKLLAEGLANPNGESVSMRLDGETFLVTAKGSDFSSLSEADLVEVKLTEDGDYKLYAAVYAARPECNAIIHSHAKFCSTLADIGRPIPPVLDDMAQIIGPTCKVAANDVKAIVKRLKGRNACLIAKDGVLTVGRTLDEAHTATLVLEKAGKVFVTSCVLGGSKIINAIEANLMHIIYKKKYSKIDQAEKLEESK